MVHELVTLVLKQVVFRHPEFRLLEECLVVKYHFRKIKERDFKVSEGMKRAPAKGMERRIASESVYETSFLDAGIQVCIIGEVIQEEDLLDGIDVAKCIVVHTARYQMIKVESTSGLSIQRFIDEMVADLGLDVKEREWVFSRVYDLARTKHGE
jgi:hypothetical protein